MARRKKSPPPLPSGPIIARVMIRVSDVRGRADDAAVAAGREFMSPEMQLSSGRAICQAQGWTLDEEASWRLRDLDQSASRKAWTKRPGMVQHVRDAQAGAYQVLIFYTLSRLARNVREGLDLWDIFDEAQISLYFVKESINTATAMGRMVRTFLLAIAEMQADQIAEYSEDMHALRAEKGRRPPRLPHWLTKQGADVVIVEEKAHVMRRLLQLRLDSLGYRSIARTLNTEGFVTPEGSEWTEDTVLKYLSGDSLERFAGVAVYHLAKGDKRIENAYPAIADPETIARVQQIRDTVRSDWPTTQEIEGWNDFRAGEKVRGKSLETNYLLSSLCRCAICGGMMRASGSQGKGRAYHCARGRINPQAHPDGGSVSLAAELAEDAVARVVRLALSELQSTSKTEAKKASKPLTPKPLPAAEDAGIILERMSRLADLLLDKKMQKKVYDRQYAEMEARLIEIESGTGPKAPSIDPQTVLYEARSAASSGEWRTAFLHLVEHVEAPVFVSGVEYFYTKSNDHHYSDGKMRRCCRVTLRIPVAVGGQMRQVFLAPMYRTTFTGEREVLGADGEPLN